MDMIPVRGANGCPLNRSQQRSRQSKSDLTSSYKTSLIYRELNSLMTEPRPAVPPQKKTKLSKDLDYSSHLESDYMWCHFSLIEFCLIFAPFHVFGAPKSFGLL